MIAMGLTGTKGVELSYAANELQAASQSSVLQILRL